MNVKQAAPSRGPAGGSVHSPRTALIFPAPLQGFLLPDAATVPPAMAFFPLDEQVGATLALHWARRRRRAVITCDISSPPCSAVPPAAVNTSCPTF